MPQLEHVGIAVQDARAFLRMVSDLFDVVPFKSEVIEQDGIRTHFVRGGAAKLELLEPTSPDSPVRRFLERRGSGLHHLAFEVDDLEAAFARLRNLGYEPLDAAPRPGADGKHIFFLHPKQTGGVLIEFCRTTSSILSPPIEAAGAVARTAGATRNPVFVHLYDDRPRMTPDALARRMEQRFFVASIQTNGSVVLADALDGLGIGKCHVAAERRSASLALSAPERLRSLAIVQPPTEVHLEGAAELPVLAIHLSDDAGLEAAARVRSASPHASVAVLPALELAGALIERHALKHL